MLINTFLFKSVNQYFCCLTITLPSFYYVVGSFLHFLLQLNLQTMSFIS